MKQTGLPAKVRKLLHILPNARYAKALRHGAAAGVEHAKVLRNLEVRTVVDIGANRGQFALVSRHCFPDASIFSFEPLAGPASTFRRVFAGDSKIELFDTAIGPSKGEATIHVSARDDSSSLLPIGKEQNRLFPGTAEARTDTIRVGRLADYVARECIATPALLKLDVQGFELSALQGCEELLPCFDHLYVECSFAELYVGQAMANDVIAWLNARRFALRGVYNMAYDDTGKAIQADFLFAKTVDSGS